jgi:hypothetical protein
MARGGTMTDPMPCFICVIPFTMPEHVDDCRKACEGAICVLLSTALERGGLAPILKGLCKHHHAMLDGMTQDIRKARGGKQ